MASQPDLFAAPVRQERVDPDDVRRELHALLALARGAIDAAPWDRRRQLFHVTVVPQMVSWLPEEEGDALRRAIMQELDRIEGLLTT